MTLLVASSVGTWTKSLLIPFQPLQIISIVDKTLVHWRLTDPLTETSVPLGIQQLYHQIQVLNNDVLAIEKQLCSFQYNQ
jgi:hypothetical protein